MVKCIVVCKTVANVLEKRIIVLPIFEEVLLRYVSVCICAWLLTEARYEIMRACTFRQLFEQ
jgi:hypothetical protein